MSAATEFYSIILGGRAGVGKTSLFQRLVYDSFSEEPTSTGPYEHGIEKGVCKTTVAGKAVKVNLWDTGGMERHASMTANYFRGCHAIVLVYSLEEEDTLFCLQDWLEEARRHSQRLVAAVWGNKCDLDSTNLQSDSELVKTFIQENQISPTLSRQVSAKTGAGTREAFEELVETIRSQFEGYNDLKSSTLEPLIDSHLHVTKKRCPC